MNLIKIWIIDDRIATATSDLLRAVYNSGSDVCLDVRPFESAEAAVLEAKEIREGRKNSCELPDIAIVDLNFNKSIDGALLNYDHITDLEIKKYVDNATSREMNQLGFWVAAEIEAAYEQTPGRKYRPIVMVFTAYPHIKQQLGWAVAPSPYCMKSYVNVQFKNGSPDELYSDIEKMLWRIGTYRVHYEGIPAATRDLFFEIADVARTRRENLNSPVITDARGAVILAANELGKELLRKRNENKLNHAITWPASALSSSTRTYDVHTYMQRPYASADDYAHLGLAEQYDKLKKSLTQLQRSERAAKLTEEEIEFYESAESRSREVSHYFPAISRYLVKDVNFLAAIADETDDLFAALGHTDHNWALARAFKSLVDPNNPNSLAKPQTPLAKATHRQDRPLKPDEEPQEEQRILHWLDSSSGLPPHTVDRIKRDGADAGSKMMLSGRFRLRQTTPMLAFGWGYGNSEFDDSWESGFRPWFEKLKIHLSDDYSMNLNIEDVPEGGPAFLTDWRYFFGHENVGENGLFSRLLAEFTQGGIEDVSAKVSVGYSWDTLGRNTEAIVSLITRSRSTISNFAGGLGSALRGFEGWGRLVSCRYESPNGRNTKQIWPRGEEVEMDWVSNEPNAFELVWVLDNWMALRTLPNGEGQ